MFKFLINPSKFNKFTDIILKPLFFITSLTLIVGLILVYFSPLDYQQGLTVKIMYVHVPSAWLSLLTYTIMTIYSIVGLVFKNTLWFYYKQSYRSNRCSFYSSMLNIRINVGETYVGHLVGLGCALNFSCYTFYCLPSNYFFK